mmetsp:Transcript_61943/g.182994  ORF Transcript_61943/g.182994 Transcript_61943/m.182994 type:complete len:232 (-) Transcript_61943:81-776(-)
MSAVVERQDCYTRHPSEKYDYVRRHIKKVGNDETSATTPVTTVVPTARSCDVSFRGDKSSESTAGTAPAEVSPPIREGVIGRILRYGRHQEQERRGCDREHEDRKSKLNGNGASPRSGATGLVAREEECRGDGSDKCRGSGEAGGCQGGGAYRRRHSVLFCRPPSFLSSQSEVRFECVESLPELGTRSLRAERSREMLSRGGRNARPGGTRCDDTEYYRWPDTKVSSKCVR